MEQKVLKPWGFYIIIEKKRSYWIKKLFIKKGGSLSLQSHQKRSELWVILSGKVKAQKSKKEYELCAEDSLKILRHEKHRITGLSNAWVLEIAFGHPLERDIIRYMDIYGRK